MTDNVRLEILLERPLVRSDRVSEIDVVVEVQSIAGAVTTRSRKPLNLCLVIDCSGSMRGAKLETAKKGCTDIYSRLKPGDQLTVVSFADDAEVVINPQTPEGEISARIAEISADGSTNLSLGWYLGLLELQTYMAENHNSRLFLLSDGQANQGETKKATLAAEASKARDLGITCSTIGIGDDFHEDLLDAIATESGGRFWYIKESKIEDILEVEFKGSLSVIVDRPRVALKFPPGVTVSRDLHNMNRISGRYRLRPINGDDIVNFAVRLSVDPAQIRDGARSLVATLYDGDDEILSTQKALSLGAPEEFVTTPINGLVKSVVQQFETSLANEQMLNKTFGTEGLDLMKKVILDDVAGMRVARDVLHAERRESAEIPMGAASTREHAYATLDADLELRDAIEIGYLDLELSEKDEDLQIVDLLREFRESGHVQTFLILWRKFQMFGNQRKKYRASEWNEFDHDARTSLLHAVDALIEDLLVQHPDKRETLIARQEKLRERLARHQ